MMRFRYERTIYFLQCPPTSGTQIGNIADTFAVKKFPYLHMYNVK